MRGTPISRRGSHAGGLILSKHYGRSCGISFPYTSSHSSRLSILAQGRDARAVCARLMRFLKNERTE